MLTQPLWNSGRRRIPTPYKSRSLIRSLAMYSSRYAECFRFPAHDLDTSAQDFVAYPRFAKQWAGLRQDSGDPFSFAHRAKAVYQQVGVDYTQKFVIFSDALDVEKAVKLKKECDGIGLKCS